MALAGRTCIMKSHYDLKLAAPPSLSMRIVCLAPVGAGCKFSLNGGHSIKAGAAVSEGRLLHGAIRLHIAINQGFAFHRFPQQVSCST